MCPIKHAKTKTYVYWSLAGKEYRVEVNDGWNKVRHQVKQGKRWSYV